MESKTNQDQEPKTEKIEIELFETQTQFVRDYSLLCNMPPEKLFRKLLVAKINEVRGMTKLPYTTVDKIVSLIKEPSIYCELSSGKDASGSSAGIQ